MRTGNNIRQRADGRYEARYPKGRDEKGRILYGCCYGRTYEEAEEKRDAILRREKPVREMNLLILGAGSHGQEVYELAQSLGVFRKVAFLDDDLTKPNVVGACRSLSQYVDAYPIAIPAVGKQELRMRWLNQLSDAGFVLPVLVHPAAVVSPNVSIGYGTVICARATVGTGSKIGNGCIISSSATLDRYVTIPDGTHIDCGRIVRIDSEHV